MWMLECCIHTKRQRTQNTISNKLQAKRTLCINSYCRGLVILRNWNFSTISMLLSRSCTIVISQFCNVLVTRFGIASVVNKIVKTFRVLWKTWFRQKLFAQGSRKQRWVSIRVWNCQIDVEVAVRIIDSWLMCLAPRFYGSKNNTPWGEQIAYNSFSNFPYRTIPAAASF